MGYCGPSYIMVFKIQWKPFFLASRFYPLSTELCYPQNDWPPLFGQQFCVRYDIYTYIQKINKMNLNTRGWGFGVSLKVHLSIFQNLPAQRKRLRGCIGILRRMVLRVTTITNQVLILKKLTQWHRESALHAAEERHIDRHYSFFWLIIRFD